MPDKITVVSESKTPQAEPVSASANERQSVSLNVAHAVALCAALLLGCFFLPWINILVGRPSGFDFAKEGGQYLAFWVAPFFCVVTFFAAITKSPVRVSAQITGCLPFALLAYGFSQVGSDLLKLLETGAYVGLGLGLALLILPARIK